MAYYLVTFHPLCGTRAGRKAILREQLPPFIDASIRREPDFQARPPSVSALCRKQFFATRLKAGDIVVYLATKAKYRGAAAAHWRVVAVLRVRKVFSSHERAAEWYRQRNRRLPRNCVVAGNPPLRLSEAGAAPQDRKSCDGTYKAIAKTWKRFLACTPLSLRLHRPSVLTHSVAVACLGHAPVTQTPKKEPGRKVRRLLAAVGMKAGGHRRGRG